MTKIAISGSSGKMGKTLIQAVHNDDALSLTAAIDHAASDVIGVDAAELVGLPANGVIITSDLSAADYDVLIDFTRPQATLEYLRICVARNKSIAIGTTGFTDTQKQELTQAAADIAIVFAANMSIGVNVSFKLMQMAARALADKADIEIIEAHHKHKVDAPSGTALVMGEVIAQELDRNLSEHGVFTRYGKTGERSADEIGFSVVRAGDIVGEHTALFALDGERIEITHKATNRNIYANGALRAAHWLDAQTTAGLFNMENVLGLG